MLQESITQDSLIKFIKNFTQGSLERFMRSSEDLKSRSLTRFSYPIKSEEFCVHSDRESCVPELHSGNFLSTVMDPTKVLKLSN